MKFYKQIWFWIAVVAVLGFFVRPMLMKGRYQVVTIKQFSYIDGTHRSDVAILVDSSTGDTWRYGEKKGRYNRDTWEEFDKK